MAARTRARAVSRLSPARRYPLPTHGAPTYQVVGLEQLPESIMLHGARAELTDAYPEAEGRPHSVRLSSAGQRRQFHPSPKPEPRTLVRPEPCPEP